MSSLDPAHLGNNQSRLKISFDQFAKDPLGEFKHLGIDLNWPNQVAWHITLMQVQPDWSPTIQALQFYVQKARFARHGLEAQERQLAQSLLVTLVDQWNISSPEQKAHIQQQVKTWRPSLTSLSGRKAVPKPVCDPPEGAQVVEVKMPPPVLGAVPQSPQPMETSASVNPSPAPQPEKLASTSRTSSNMTWLIAALALVWSSPASCCGARSHTGARAEEQR